MDAFSYLSVLISIILGLAITQILQGLRGLVINRRHVAVYWPSVAWAGLLLLINVQAWWAMYGMRQKLTWTFLEFAMVLLQVIVLYMLAGLVLPDLQSSNRTNLKQHYFEQARWFYGLAVFLLVVSVTKDVVLDGRMPKVTNLAFHGLWASVWATGAFTTSESYHRWIPALTILSFVAYIGLLFGRL
jgi:hypothetical protein